MKAIETIAYRTYRAVIITGVLPPGTTYRDGPPAVAFSAGVAHVWRPHIPIPAGRIRSAKNNAIEPSRTPSFPPERPQISSTPRPRGCAETPLVQESPAEGAEGSRSARECLLLPD